MAENQHRDADNEVVVTRRQFFRLPSGWNSFETTKLGVEILKGIAFPVALAYVGLAVARNKQSDEALVSRRIKSLDVIAPAANDILCFVTIVGHWNKLSPDDVINRKRIIDQEMWTYIGIWSQEVWNCYRRFDEIVFEEYGGGSSKPAAIYGDISHLRAEMKTYFNDAWEKCFKTPPPWWSKNIVQINYVNWMRAMRKDIRSAAE